jgi:ArsR family transcriptional regulator
MDKSHSLDALSALSQETRLDVFRLLTRAEPVGMCAGEIAAAMDARQNTISTNLAILAQAGLIRSVREGRNMRYYANLEGMRDLLSYRWRIAATASRRPARRCCRRWRAPAGGSPTP